MANCHGANIIGGTRAVGKLPKWINVILDKCHGTYKIGTREVGKLPNWSNVILEESRDTNKIRGDERWGNYQNMQMSFWRNVVAPKMLKNLFVQIRNFLLQVLDLGDDAFERLLVPVL